MHARIMSFLLTAVLLVAGGLTPARATQQPQGAPNAINLSEEPGISPEASTSTQDSQRYAVQIRASNARIFVRVNDIPVFFKLLRDVEVVDVQFNEWIHKGLNIVQISAEKFDDGAPASLNYNVYYQSPSQLATGEKFILFMSAAEASLPLRQPVGFRAQTIPPLRIWQTDELDFSTEEQARLLDMINGFRVRMLEAVGRADNAFLATYDKLIRDEVSRAYGRTPESEADVISRRRALAETLKKEVNAQVKSTPALEVSELEFEPVADGRLVRVSRLDGKPLIDIERGSLHYVIDKPIYGRIGGIWEMLRF